MLDRARIVLPAMMVVLAGPLAAQTMRVRGDVVDRASGFAVPGADVTFYRGDTVFAATRTDERGRFDLRSVPYGTIVVRARRFGFTQAELEVAVGTGLEPLRFRLDAAPAELDSVEVTAEPGSLIKLASFRRRKDSNRQGIFIERADFPRNAQRLSEAFRRVPGAQLRASDFGSRVRLRNCRPSVWVDGVKALNAEIDEVAAIEDVAALEVYTSLTQAPPQYQDRDTRCGSVLIWLR